MNKWLCLILSTLVVVCSWQPVLAAESTADVVVNRVQKEKLRKKIVGNLVLPGKQQKYIIGLGDILSINVYGEGEMTASSAAGNNRSDVAVAGGNGDILRQPGSGGEVRLDGRISLKHIGDIEVAGMTLTQAADYLKNLYKTVFDDPVVSVVLVQSNSRRYTVMGKVKNPGIFYLDFPVTIIQAIARSGGFNEWANHDVTIIRQGSGPMEKRKLEKKILTFDYDNFLKGRDLDRNIYLQPNDVMIVH